MICDFKNSNLQSYIIDFKLVPLDLVYATDESDEQISFLNQLILKCIDEHTSLKKTKPTRLSEPWMKSKNNHKIES